MFSTILEVLVSSLYTYWHHYETCQLQSKITMIRNMVPGMVPYYTKARNYRSCTYTEVTALLLWSISAVTM